MTELAKDRVGNTLPAFRWGKMHRLPIDREQEVTPAFSPNTSVVGVLATAPFRFKCGRDPKVSRNCPKILANMWITLRVTPEDRMAVMWDGDSGEIEITEME